MSEEPQNHQQEAFHSLPEYGWSTGNVPGTVRAGKAVVKHTNTQTKMK